MLNFLFMRYLMAARQSSDTAKGVSSRTAMGRTAEGSSSAARRSSGVTLAATPSAAGGNTKHRLRRADASEMVRT